VTFAAKIHLSNQLTSPLLGAILLHSKHQPPSRKENLIMTYKITTDCIMCGACEAECPEGAITAGDTQYIIDPNLCKDCASCADVCPTGACVPA
jgi:ferredoxin